MLMQAQYSRCNPPRQEQTSPPARPASSWPPVTALRAMWAMCDALREGLAAYRQYEHLRSRGVRHDTALGEALGIGRKPTIERQSNALPPALERAGECEHEGGTPVISEIEARACRHAFMTPTHPYTWGRLLGPLMVWAAFLVLMVVGVALAPDLPPSILASGN